MELDEIFQKSKETKPRGISTLSGEKREIRNRYSLTRQGLVGVLFMCRCRHMDRV